ncbi:AMP-binding protein [Alteribacillus iranensis]|uniref:Long-chain acyl-CoA synthetase n=1 Tax=Alteribacillus iranensis TaxID=930128 RepID=A0A1I2CLZ0_9BACI|nr:AMP-binding protein [Alteribacillus iranensis]SFE69152.1 long-chain acyl-CoA synthetase [Alteribacillus iranensis]
MTKRKRWHDSYPEDVPVSIQYDEKPLHSYLEEAADRYPHKTALHFMGKKMTYSQVYQEASNLCGHLIKLGVTKGERIAVMLPNSPQAVISYYAALMTGAIVVQTNPLYVERELEHQMKDSGAKWIICLDLLYPRIKKIRNVTSLQHVIITSLKDYLPFPKNVLYPLSQKKNNNRNRDTNNDKNVHSFRSLVKQGTTLKTNVVINPQEDLALLQYTGGTTGTAKGVMLTHYNLVANALQCQAWMSKMKKGEEKMLAVLPFFHVYGLTVVMNLSIMHVCQMIILPKFDADLVLKSIHKHQVTLFPGAPTMYVGLIHTSSLKKYDLSSIEACISGSAPLPGEVQDTFEALTHGRLVEGYGLTEGSPVITANPIWGGRKTGSIGIPWPDTDVCVYSSDGTSVLPAGEIGELAVRGPQVMKGYWNHPEETTSVFIDDWLLTGDMGYMDEDGYFYISDRKKDMIVAGGFNIFPREVEEVLYEHPSVQEAAVIGVRDPYRGETVKACIVRKKGESVTEEELDAFCREHLAVYKIPRLFEFRQSLPKTTIGKVLKRKLLEEESHNE